LPLKIDFRTSLLRGPLTLTTATPAGAGAVAKAAIVVPSIS